ncbi:speract receptor-like isoform X2 [Lineus longissimus]|uniref:speract receptor-like isoform X2 n=1 Tax=Lineus longissimus TaxID=88925 RepID=UPI002B4D305C
MEYTNIARHLGRILRIIFNATCVLCVFFQLLHLSAGKEDIKIGYIMGADLKEGVSPESYYRPGKRTSGAVQLAIDEINNSTEWLPDHRLTLVVKDTYGNEEYSIKHTISLKWQNVSVIIGPQDTCQYEGRIAAAYNLPMISYYCNDAALSDKVNFPTFARTKPQAGQIAKSVIAYLKNYDWNKVTLVYYDKGDNGPVTKAAEAIQELVVNDPTLNITTVHRYTQAVFFGLDANQGTEPNEDFASIIKETYKTTRIYVLVADVYAFPAFPVALQHMGLLAKGEYFVVGVDVDHYSPENVNHYLNGMAAGEDKADMSNIHDPMRSIVIILPSPPKYPDFTRFAAVVNDYLENPPFNYFKSPFGIDKTIPMEAGYLYDAVWLYAKAAHKLLEMGERVDDGRAIFKELRGKEYISINGFGNRIDDNGDCEGNYTIIARRPPDLAKDRKSWGMYPIGVFRRVEGGNLTVAYFENETMQWVGKTAPLAEPKCGYFGKKCNEKESNTEKIVAGAIGGVVLLAVIIGSIIYRNWKYEQDLAKMLWRVDWKDVVTKEKHHALCQNLNSLNDSNTGNKANAGNAMTRMSSHIRSSLMSLESQGGDLELRHSFCQVGTYKGNLVAVKRVAKKSVDLTRNVQKELKLLKDIRHDNLTQFIGACVMYPNIAYLTEYCPKGSLQDVLENDDVKLDNVFIASIVNDILKGLTVIHESEIHFHGRLKSSNCLIDSRWVLKLTDFGLSHFRSGEDKKEDGDYAHFRSLLWTAPELLRNPSCPGTQKGDIYSVAVILYEIHSRNGPYGDTEMTPQEIIKKVKHPESILHPFRPRLGNLDSTAKFITDCISECWCEIPQNRPDMRGIRNILKPLQKGLKSNIMDNMIAIMERYANNLEGVIEERTEQLLEEKKRTEELLHQMLPKSVAEQLKQGKQVEAEVFESVTIYFSDICGFTALSSESTPMQVVDLLNDLYTTFDFIIGNFDVYKVETIGDAYMVVSGLPTRNGINHAGEIASMSLALLSAIKKFKIRHRPDECLKLRIGIHSGSCVAGVVGLKMPRFCLFGDCVNTSSRMESNGLPLKIHCSPQCKQLLDELKGFEVEERGLVKMKGKGEIRTYWVIGDKNSKTRKFSSSQSSVQTPNHSNESSDYDLSQPSSPVDNKGLPNGTKSDGDDSRSTSPSKKHPSSPLKKFFQSGSKSDLGNERKKSAGQVPESLPLLPRSQQCAPTNPGYRDKFEIIIKE